MRWTLNRLLLAVLVCGGIVLGGASFSSRIALAPNASWEGELDFEHGGRLDFELELPPDAVLSRVTLLSDVAELQLCGQPLEAVADVHDALYDGSGADGPPALVFDCLGPDPVGGTTWYFAAYWPFAGLPRVGNQVVRRTTVTLEVETFNARVDAQLTAGEPFASALDEASGGFRTFRIDVPAGAPALRLDLFEVSSDLDLYARAGGQILALGDDAAFAENGWGHETLVLDARSEPPLAAGAWYIDVVDALGPTRTLPFKILASFDAAAPERLRALPTIPSARGASGVARALHAVVEITTSEGSGSGTLLGRKGWILTNAHVIGTQERPEIVVSLTLDPTLPAEELFRAGLARIDFERDLALLQIESGLYGQALPQGYALPTLELGSAAGLTIGDPLWLIGYPSTGGTGSRVTISATRGIVAGFERADFGVLIKTDAEITRGNSGGAALDERGLLVGVPSSTVEDGSGQIGYVHPIDALPAEWLELLAR
ncbi:MAG: serine protease [Planctomycetes bacterium]|nr:serine protease [Planctomycetota bacterium]